MTATGAGAQSMNYGSLQDLFGEPVTTSATGKPQRASEAPAAMSIIGADEIARSGARTLPDVLNRVTGVDVMNWGVSSADVGVRGYNQPYNPRLLVLVNGRQVYLDHYGVTEWSAIPVQMSEIRQIEVVKGPQAALFGFNAVSGVVNIITYSPLYDEVGQAQATFGTQNRRDFSAAKSLKLGDKVGVRVSAGGWNVDEFGNRREAREQLVKSDAIRRTASFDSLAQLLDNVQAGFETTWSRIDHYETSGSAVGQNGKYETRSFKGTVTADTGAGLITGTAYSNHLDFDLTSAAGATSSIRSKNTDTVAQLQDLIKLSSTVTLRAGAEFRDNAIDVAPITGATVGYKVYALSGMVDWQALDSLDLTAAGRWDHLALHRSGFAPAPYTNADYDRDIDTFSYNLGAVWKVTPTDSVHAFAGRGIQSPTLVELGFYTVSRPTPTINIPITGNPFLEPTVVTNYELGYDHPVALLGGAFKGAVFYQKTRDYKALPYGGTVTVRGVPSVIWRNAGDSELWGIEASIDGTFQPVRWSLGWTWLDTADSFLFNRTAPNQTPVNFEASTPRNTVKANLGYDVGKWSADLFLVWKSDFKQFYGTAAGNVLRDVSPGLGTQAAVTYRFTDRLALTVAAKDFLKSDTQVSAAPKVERQVWATLTARF
jgi:iron complex outermembrane receptor protein